MDFIKESIEKIDKFHKSNVNLRQLSRKTGLTALHIAAYYGNEGENLNSVKM